MVGDNPSDGIPLLTRVLLVRATARFDPSFRSDAHRSSNNGNGGGGGAAASASSSPLPINTGRSPPTGAGAMAAATALPPYTETGAIHVRPTLRIVAHYAQSKGTNNSNSSANSSRTASGTAGAATASSPNLRSATSTPKEDAEFFASHATLHQLLNSLASDRLSEKVKMRQVQTDIARTTVKLARASTSAAAAGNGGGGGPAGTAAATAAPLDPGSFFTTSFTAASASYPAPPPRSNGLHTSTTSVDDDTSQTNTSSSNTNNHTNASSNHPLDASSPQVQGMLAAATATFAEDATWRSLTTPYRPQLNPWSLLSVADEGCYLSLPSPAYVHWCELQAARCCAAAATGGGGGGGDVPSTEPDVQNGPMRYNDVVHFASVDGVGKGSSSFKNSTMGEEESGYMHGYAFLLDGAVFAGANDVKNDTTDAAPFTAEDGEVSVLLWCVLSDAPIFNFMRTLTLEVAAAMSYVAQRTYHATAESLASRDSANSTNRSRGENGGSTSSVAAATIKGSRRAGVARADYYTGLLDSTLDEEVVRPLAAELLCYGTTASRTLPGESFTVSLPLTRGTQSGVAARPQTTSMSGNLNFRRPLDLLFPYADVPLSVLLLSFGEDALRVLQSLLLQEERVVVIGATAQHASACVLSLLSLIAPFTWVSPLVPYLPPHTAAQTGLLYTLLSAPFELQQQNQQQCSTPMSSRPAAYSSNGGVASQSSQQMESAGFLIGSTAGIRPYLMFLSAFGVTEDGGQRGPRSGRSPRVWLADARTGAVGVCPTEPISQFLLADAKPSSPSGVDEGVVDNGSISNSSSSATAHAMHYKDRSCTPHGGASAWTFPAHLDLRVAAPQLYSHSGGGGGGGGGGTSMRSGARNPYVLYTAVRNSLRTAAELNVLDATPLDVLPPFNDELCEALRRVAPPEKRRQFRQALEELSQHTQVRLDGLTSLAARLVRGLRQALKASAAAAAAAAAASSTSSSFGSHLNQNDNPLRMDSFSADSIDSSYSSGSDSSDSSDSEEDDADTFKMDENASFRAVTEAVAQSHSVTFTDPSSNTYLAQLPTLSSHETWQVQSAFLGYVVGRLAGAYRRGLTVISGASHRSGGKRRFMEPSVFLAPGLDQHYTLAETVARTHLFRQFECAVLATETIGLRRVLGGCGLQIGSGGSLDASLAGAGRSGETHAMMKLVRPLAMFAILCDRARLQYPELYADVPGLDAVGTVYSTLVKRCFFNRPGPPTAVSVPPAIRSIAGNSAASDPNRAAMISSSSAGSYSSGGSGGGLRGFFSKAAKAMKLHGSGNNNNNSGGGGGSGGGRGLPVLYIPASVACMNSFAVAPFSAQLVAPESFNIITYDTVGLDGKVHRGRHRHHHHKHDYAVSLDGSTNPKKHKKGRRHLKKAYLAALYAIPVKPQRQQWARQQQHQQRTAISIDFTLDDCTSVVRNHNVPGGVSGSLTASFSGSSAAAAAAAAAAVNGGLGGGGSMAGLSNGSVYVSGVGIDAEVLTALARAGGGGYNSSSDAATRVMAETSLSVCHALPLDIVHQFDAYEPLLAPVVTVTSTRPASPSASASSPTASNTVAGGAVTTTTTTVIPVGVRAAAVEADVMSPMAYMAVGLLCPSCVSVWREGEARAARVLMEQRQQQQQQQQQQLSQSQAQSQRSPKRKLNPSPPQQASPVTPQLPPKPVRLFGASTPLEAQSWSTPPATPTPSFPSQLLTSSVAAANAAGTGATAGLLGSHRAGGNPHPSNLPNSNNNNPLTASWGTFTSGAPLGFPIYDAPPTLSKQQPPHVSSSNNNNNNNNNNPTSGSLKSNPMLSAVGWGNAASQDLSTTFASASAPLLSAAASPAPPMPRPHAHQDVWDNWGVQAPVVVNTPNTATAGAPHNAGSLSVTTNTNPNAMTASEGSNDGLLRAGRSSGSRGDMLPRLAPTLALSNTAGGVGAAAATASASAPPPPLTAPAPGDVMDELFAGLSSYNTGVSSNNESRSAANSAILQQQQQQQARRQTLDDFF